MSYSCPWWVSLSYYLLILYVMLSTETGLCKSIQSSFASLLSNRLIVVFTWAVRASAWVNLDTASLKLGIEKGLWVLIGGKEQGLFRSSAGSVFLHMAVLNRHWAKEALRSTSKPTDRETQLAVGGPVWKCLVQPDNFYWVKYAQLKWTWVLGQIFWVRYQSWQEAQKKVSFLFLHIAHSSHLSSEY